MSNLFIIPLAIFLPWLAFLFMGEIAAALIALILQATIIGWIPASIWAIKTCKRKQQAKEANTPHE